MNGLQKSLVITTLTAALAAAGCSGPRAVPVSSPETGVRMVLDAARASNDEKAAGYFQGGTDAYRQDPYLFSSFLSVISDDRAAVAFAIEAAQYQAMEAALQVSTYADEEKQHRLQTATWRFERMGAGWVVREVNW